jgi:2-methylisocitrate lyase-like PEP mutase family enzyme
MAERAGFDGVWASSFEISASYAVPDASIVSQSEHLAVARNICTRVDLPVVSDCETGYGDELQFAYPSASMKPLAWRASALKTSNSQS